MKFKVKKIKEITIKLNSEEADALLMLLRDVDCTYLSKDYKEMVGNLCRELSSTLED